MTEILEKDEFALEGQVETPHKRQRVFNNLVELTNYIRSFNIKHGAFGGVNKNGSNIFILEYDIQDGA